MTRITVPGFSVLRAPLQKKLIRDVSVPLREAYPRRLIKARMDSYQSVQKYKDFVSGSLWELRLMNLALSDDLAERQIKTEIRLSGIVQGVGMRGTIERIINNLNGAPCAVRNERDGSVFLGIEASFPDLLILSRLICPGRGYHLVAGTDQEAEKGKVVVVGKGGLVPDNAKIVWTSHIQKVDWTSEGLSFGQFLEVQKERIGIASVVEKILKYPLRLYLTPLELLLSQILENRDFNYSYSERNCIKCEEGSGESWPYPRSNAPIPVWDSRSSIDREWNRRRTEALNAIINASQRGSVQARKALVEIIVNGTRKDLFYFSPNLDGPEKDRPKFKMGDKNVQSNMSLIAQAMRRKGG